VDSLVAGIAADPKGGGYWLVGSDGGIHSFGDAGFFGSTAVSASIRPWWASPHPDGRGYWMTTLDGSVYAFGDATGGHPQHHGLNGLGAAGIVSTPSGFGYWLVNWAPAFFTFGHASPIPTPVIPARGACLAALPELDGAVLASLWSGCLA